MDFEVLAKICDALGDPVRAHILQFIAGCNCCCEVGIGEDGGVIPLSGPTAGQVCCHVDGGGKINSRISFHLNKLKQAGLIEAEKRGKYIVCWANREMLSTLSQLFANMANAQWGKEKRMSGELTEREDVRELVRRKYGEAALRILKDEDGSCCGTPANIGCCGSPSEESGACCSNAEDPITKDLYSDAEAEEIPEAALLASLGCGNPTALASLNPGETVLDLGSGGGIDVLLSAKRVGPAGFAYGLDMTDEMLALAERNKAEAGAENVKFLKGHIEDIPLPDNTVDVIISNCVINLSADKDRVLAEAFRVLKPGGRFAVSDVVVEGDLPEAVRRDMELYVGCVAGALEKTEYLEKLARAGFIDATVQPTRKYKFSQLEGAWATNGVANMTLEERTALDDKIMGAFIRAVKPS